MITNIDRLQLFKKELDFLYNVELGLLYIDYEENEIGDKLHFIVRIGMRPTKPYENIRRRTGNINGIGSRLFTTTVIFVDLLRREKETLCFLVCTNARLVFGIKQTPKFTELDGTEKGLLQYKFIFNKGGDENVQQTQNTTSVL